MSNPFVCIGSCGKESPPSNHIPPTKKFGSKKLGDNLAILLEWTHEALLLLWGLEATMAHLGSGVDELEVDVLQSGTGSLLQQGLAEGDGTLLGANNATLDENEVVLDKTVVNKATNGVDRLVGDVDLGGTVVLDKLAVDGVVAGADAVDLLVDLGTVMVTLLTRSGNGEGDTGWMPCTNTGDLAETLVSLAWELLGVPSGSDTVVTATLGDTNSVDHLVLGEDGVDGDLLLEVVVAPLDLLGNGTTVDLDLDQVGLLLAEGESLHLSVADGADGDGVLLEKSQVTVNGLLAIFGLVLLGGLGESLLLGREPVLVESAADFVGETGSPDGLDGAWSVWGVDVTGDTDDLEWWGLDDGDGLNDLLLVDGGAGLLGLADDVGHTGLETNESSQVNWLFSIILGEGFWGTAWADTSLLGQEL